MPESLTNIKRRITSTKKTRQITNAMHMVSAAKLSQIEKKSNAYQIYTSKIREIVTHLAATQLIQIARDKAVESETKEPANTKRKISVNDLLVSRPVKKIGYLVITSDRGLVGAYNSNVLRSMMELIQKDHKALDDYVILAIGGNGADFFKKRGLNVAYEYRGISDVPTFDEVREIMTTAITLYDNGVYDELYVCFNHHVNSLSSTFRAEKMLPINDLDVSEVQDKNLEYITDPNPEKVLDVILPQYAESLLFGSIMDAKTAEHAASMTSMKSATDNAENLISSLSTQYNRARQAAITTELSEITGGAAAQE